MGEGVGGKKIKCCFVSSHTHKMPVDPHARFPEGTDFSATAVFVPGRSGPVAWVSETDWVSCLGADFIVVSSRRGEVTVVVYEPPSLSVQYQLGNVFPAAARGWLLADCFLVGAGQEACTVVRYPRHRHPKYYEANLCLPATCITYLIAEKTGRYFAFYDHTNDTAVVMDSKDLSVLFSAKGAILPRDILLAHDRILLVGTNNEILIFIS